MIKHKLPDIITEKDFNDETLELIRSEGNILNKLSGQHAYQVITGLFEQDKNLDEISLDSSEEYDDEGGYYLNLNVNIGLVDDNADSENDLSQEVYDCCVDVIDESVLSRLEGTSGVVIKRDDLDSYRSLAEVLFSRDDYVDEYFDVLSKDDGSVLPTDYITSKNIDNFDAGFFYKESEVFKNLENQMAVWTVKKLFDDPYLNYLKISAEKDKGGLSLSCFIDLNNSEVNFNEYHQNVYDSLTDVMNIGMLRALSDAEPIKIERGSVSGIKELVDVLFDNDVSSSNFLTVLVRGGLEDKILKKDNVSRPRSKI